MAIIGDQPKLFGTDGVRGLVNKKITPIVATMMGLALGYKYRNGGGTRVLIGKDTRRSGYMIESALTAGITAAGMDVDLIGPIPTPAVAMLMRSMQARIGIMISASHNPSHDNGIKIFGPDRFKLSDEEEREIERLMSGDSTTLLVTADLIGRARRVEGGIERYIELAKNTLGKSVNGLKGIRIVVDCANGAAYKAAPAVFRELGAEVFSIGVDPTGYNINENVGSTSPGALQAEVRKLRADIGIALDGDADRVIILDENGTIVDGDQFLALIAKSWIEEGRLRKPAVAATVMSNLGFDEYLKGLGADVVRTNVGDRYVLEAMRREGINLGGEQSGHIVMTDFTTTGDGIIAALQVLTMLKEKGVPMSKLAHTFERIPQVLKNVEFKHGSHPLKHERVIETIDRWQKQLGERGLLVRASGTEPVIRVMAQHKDAGLVGMAVSEIASAIQNSTEPHREQKPAPKKALPKTRQKQ
jgi:phosphoglucosamine mutase